MYMCVYVCVYIYIYIERERDIYMVIIMTALGCRQMELTLMGPLQSNDFRQIGKKGTPWHFWMIKVGQREYPKGPSVKKHKNNLQ